MESCVAGVGGNVQPDLMELFHVSGTKAGLVRTEGIFVTAPIGADDFHDQPWLRFWEAFQGVPSLFGLLVGGEFSRQKRHYTGRLEALGGQQKGVKNIGATNH